jgi:hypothetical protein
MKNITLTTQLKHQPRILKQEAAGTVVLLELDGGHYYAIEGAGGRAWELCNGQRNLSEIGRIIGEEYDAAAQNIEHDLLELFTELANEHLVEASV